jgi:hypothetical protein
MFLKKYSPPNRKLLVLRTAAPSYIGSAGSEKKLQLVSGESFSFQ